MPVIGIVRAVAQSPHRSERLQRRPVRPSPRLKPRIRLYHSCFRRNRHEVVDGESELVQLMFMATG